MILSSPESLHKLEVTLGIEGKRLRIPSIFGRPVLEVPFLYVVSILILLYLGGPRAMLPLVALGYFIVTSHSSRD